MNKIKELLTNRNKLKDAIIEERRFLEALNDLYEQMHSEYIHYKIDGDHERFAYALADLMSDFEGE